MIIRDAAMDVEGWRVIPGLYKMPLCQGLIGLVPLYTMSVLGHSDESSMQMCVLGYNRSPHRGTGLCEGGQLGNGCPVAMLPSPQHTCLHSLKAPTSPRRASRGLLKDPGIQTESRPPQPAERLLVFQTYSLLGTEAGRGTCDLPAPSRSPWNGLRNG